MLRKLISLALLSILSLPLISAATSANPESKLPPCCRRDGKHHCSMAMAGNDVAPETGGPALKPVKATCASYPVAKSSPAVWAFLTAPAPSFAGPVTAELDAVAQAEARYRIAYNRARQKRGPPSSHS
jgi:hypothetical protein